MRAVHSCDFCGDDAVGTYEVVPDDLLRSDADQRRVSLCSHCHDTLEDVLEPFLDGGSARTAELDTADENEADENKAEQSAASAATEQAPTSAAVDADARAEGIAIGRSDSESDGASDTADVPTEPEQFRKVMRLLNNREFPVERAGFAELASSAYELEEDHVADILDYAVERGVVTDDGGVLRKN